MRSSFHTLYFLLLPLFVLLLPGSRAYPPSSSNDVAVRGSISGRGRKPPPVGSRPVFAILQEAAAQHMHLLPEILPAEEDGIDLVRGDFADGQDFSLGIYNSQKHTVFGLATVKGAFLLRIAREKLRDCYDGNTFNPRKYHALIWERLFGHNGKIMTLAEEWRVKTGHALNKPWFPSAFRMLLSAPGATTHDRPTFYQAVDQTFEDIERYFLKVNSQNRVGIPSILDCDRVTESLLSQDVSQSTTRTPGPVLGFRWKQKDLKLEAWMGRESDMAPEVEDDLLPQSGVGYFPLGFRPLEPESGAGGCVPDVQPEEIKGWDWRLPDDA